MKTLKSILAVTLSIAMSVESAQALPLGSSESNSAFSISLPSSLGYVSSTYAASKAAKPDVILIQDLHVNRSVQFAISGILKRLKAQGFMPDHIAVEGETGPVDIRAMQAYPDSKIRKEAADYLVEQGEMPGAMHYAVVEGGVGLFGIETDEYYQANLDMFRRSYAGRTQLRSEIEKIQAVLPKLIKDPATRNNASILGKDLEAVSQLINNQVIPDELLATLGRAASAVDHIKAVLPQETASQLVQPLSASINFYSLALLRNEELFKNSLAARELGHQKTTIVVAGGFHTEALADMCKKQGLSYAVITPNVKRHNKIDEKLYVERLMGHHLTPEQVATGQDWAAMQMLAVAQKALSLWRGAITQTHKAVFPVILTAALLGWNAPAVGKTQSFSSGKPVTVGNSKPTPSDEARVVPVNFSVPQPDGKGGYTIVVTGQNGPINLKGALSVRFAFPSTMALKKVSVVLSVSTAGARSKPVTRTIDAQGVLTIGTGEFMDAAERLAPNHKWVETTGLTMDEINSDSEFSLTLPGHDASQLPLRMELMYPIFGPASVKQDFEAQQAPDSFVKQAWDSIFGVTTHAQELQPSGSKPSTQAPAIPALNKIDGHPVIETQGAPGLHASQSLESLGQSQFIFEQPIDHPDIAKDDYLVLDLASKQIPLQGAELALSVGDPMSGVGNYRFVIKRKGSTNQWAVIPKGQPALAVSRFVEPEDRITGYNAQVEELAYPDGRYVQIRIPLADLKGLMALRNAPITAVDANTSKQYDGEMLNPAGHVPVDMLVRTYRIQDKSAPGLNVDSANPNTSLLRLIPKNFEADGVENGLFAYKSEITEDYLPGGVNGDAPQQLEIIASPQKTTPIKRFRIQVTLPNGAQQFMDASVNELGSIKITPGALPGFFLKSLVLPPGSPKNLKFILKTQWDNFGTLEKIPPGVKVRVLTDQPANVELRPAVKPHSKTVNSFSVGRLIISAMTMLLGTPLLAAAQGQTVATKEPASSFYQSALHTLANVSFMGWGVVIAAGLIVGGLYGLSRRVPGSLKGEPASVGSSIVSGVLTGVAVILLGAFGWGYFLPLPPAPVPQTDKTDQPSQTEKAPPKTPEAAVPVTETAPAAEVKHVPAAPAEPAFPPSETTPEPIVQPEPVPVNPPRIREGAPVINPPVAPKASQVPAINVSSDHEYLDITVSRHDGKPGAIPHVYLEWASGGYANNSNSKMTSEGRVYRIFKNQFKDGTLRVINMTPGTPVNVSFSLGPVKTPDQQSLPIFMPIPLMGMSSALSTHRPIVSFALFISMSLVGVLIQRQVRQRGLKATFARVLAGLGHMNEAVRATPAAILRLAVPASLWLKNNPIVQYHNRLKIAEMAKQTALRIGA